MKKLISEELNSALNEQIGHEKYNANLYMCIAGFLANKGFSNLAKKFEEQHDEETEHSKMIYSFLTELNSPVVIPQILGCSSDFDNIIQIAESYLEREMETTESLNEIKKLAIDEDSPVVEEFMRDMIKLQRKEYEEACDFLDKAELTNNDWKLVMNWDLEV